MSVFTERKASFKQPPRSVIDRAVSQEARRSQALEEQKHRRAKRIESERHIDLFADLKLGDSDDEAGDEAEIVREGVGQLASMLQSDTAPSPLPSTGITPPDLIDLPTSFQSKRRGKRKKNAVVKQVKQKPNPWAEKIMYAELLEMPETDPWSVAQNFDLDADEPLDGLPHDLQTGWVAVGPVPVGKRCLAVSHQGSGTIGLVPNTTLRSRVLGKPLMPRFPSPLPSDTILDCILDQNWHDNGVLHVLDVLKWKGQDVADCESSFRFWWRDTRLSELPPPRPPTTSGPTSPRPNLTGAPASDDFAHTGYKFPYPTTFVPVSYHTDTTFSHLLSTVIPLARSSYNVPTSIPVTPDSALEDGESVMDVETPYQFTAGPTVRPSQAEINSDGLLLYVAQAIYEPGTSPLSSWVPQVSPVAGESIPGSGGKELVSPLNVFESLVRRRLAREQSPGHLPDEVMQS